MKPTIQDVKDYFKDARFVKHPNIDKVFDMSDYHQIFDNGTGGFNAYFAKGTLVLYSGITGKYSEVLTTPNKQ